jgi:moderate conductance mechanosensitive channel
MGRALIEGEVEWQLILTALFSTLLLAWLVARCARRLTAGAFLGLLGPTLAPGSALVRGPLRVVFFTTLALVSALLLFPALDWAGLHPLIGSDGLEIANWFLGPGLRIVVIALVAYTATRATNLLVRRFELEVSKGATVDKLERARRAHTLGTVVRNAVNGLILGTAAVMVLNEIGVNVAPVLTGAGIAGVALGLGSQTLVRDFLSGFFLIWEDQVRVGDGVAINGTDGRVEQLNLRTISVRDAMGTVHVFPNGAINTLANHSRDYSHYVIDLNIPYDEDPDRVSEVVREVDRDLRGDPTLEPQILEPVEILGIAAFADWWMQLRIRIKTVPGKQGAIGREFRKRLRKALDRHRIEVPYPAVRPRP